MINVIFLRIQTNFNIGRLFEKTISNITEIPGNDRHAYQYPDVRIISDDEYGSNTYEDEDDEIDSMKSNRVPDRANKWYSNDGKTVLTTTGSGGSTTTITTTTIFLCLIKSLL